MRLFSEAERQQIVDRLRDMRNPVKIVYFTQELDCEACPVVRELLEDVVELSDKLTLEIYNFHVDKDKVAQYRVDKTPAIIVEGAKDYGIRFYGLPAGFEFAALLEDILQVSQGRSNLQPEFVSRLADLKSPVHLEVLVTPT